jgi:hypothetical protein
MDDNDWFLIDGFIQDIRLVRRGLAAESFNNDLNRRLEEICENQETINQLRIMSEDTNTSNEGSAFGKILGLFKEKLII